MDDEYVTKCLELLRYVPYLRDEKVKIQRFVSGFPLSFKYRIEINEPQTLNDIIKKLKHCYKHSRSRLELKDDLKAKGNLEIRGKRKESSGKRRREKARNSTTSRGENQQNTNIVHEGRHTQAKEEDGPSCVGNAGRTICIETPPRYKEINWDCILCKKHRQWRMQCETCQGSAQAWKIYTCAI